MGILPSYFVLLRSYKGGSVLGSCLVVWYLATVFLGDSGAYMAGRQYGKRKLAPVISPNKSWEGVLGGFLTALFIAALFRYVTLPNLPLLHLPLLVLVLECFAVLGDLFESMLKRSVKVKDSGGLFPGHGGVLDRLDAALVAVPVFYYYIRFVLEW
jgi:phosphatidate cytidylyltransferase